MIKDKAIEPTAATPQNAIPLEIVTALSLTSAVVASVQPGYAFEVVKVEDFARTVTATITYDCKVGTMSVLAATATPVAATRTTRTLATSRASRRGTSSSALTVELTTNGTGAATNMKVTVWIRPYPLNGEV